MHSYTMQIERYFVPVENRLGGLLAGLPVLIGAIGQGAEGGRAAEADELPAIEGHGTSGERDGRTV